MGYEAKVILDSVAPCGKRLTTITATYPRFIHSEILTHRDRARNSASSRAIPFKRLQQMVMTEPVVPLKWGMEQTGMQTGDEIPDFMREHAKSIWLRGLNYMTLQAMKLQNIGICFLDEMREMDPEWQAPEGFTMESIQDIKIHKSLCNRLIEPWMWITVVMTATEWKNFFRLRCHPAAEIHFQKIAGMIRDVMEASMPTELKAGEWHLPFVQKDELENKDIVYCEGARQETIEILKKASVARCARVSYLTHEGKRDISKDLELYEKLANGVADGHPHASPFEHVAQAMETPVMKNKIRRSGPFIGWKQFRKSIPNECAD